MLCFDICANTGKWSLANKDKYKKIISVEASPSAYKKLLDNTSSFKNITCLNYAVCDNNNHLSTTMTYASITLDKLVEHYGTPDLIKIDVDFGEYLILQYLAISSLSTKVPIICFEWTSEMNEVTLKCLEHLSNLGFNKYYIQCQDEYTFQPDKSDYKSLEDVKTELFKTIPKVDWGMIWAI